MENEKQRILVVDDEEIARKNLVHILEKVGYAVVSADSGMRALDLLRDKYFDLVITDLKMEKVDGMEVLKQTKKLQPDTDTVMITGYATVDSAIKALKKGAYHYIAKPYKIDEVRKIVSEALLKRNLLLENKSLKTSLESTKKFPFIIGESDVMQDIKTSIKQIAPSDTNVLVLGESGTGKELTAKAIHQLSNRSKNKFLAFNCGSFTEELMANELFGHEKEAFSGAVQEKRGLLETANKGTVFLDEIGDMPLSMQVKLLRVIQEKEFLRVGGVHPISTNVRFIAATHRDLEKDVKEGRFRQDLYYRLNVICLKISPLVKRHGDIKLLAYHFLNEKNKMMEKDIKEIDKDAMALLLGYDWPGNVRELENVIERAVVLEKRDKIYPENLPDSIRSLSIETYRHNASSIPSLEEQEKHYIEWVLKKCNWNKTKAAKIMGIDRVSLWRKIKRYDLEIKE
ncbi:MAG: sigma-54-dependent Fis family transcriptional regulator [Deltaproteobacteria bacterium]|nr:sigma-54-dependent Fis family transcriptional regulator [Deltaproteobacteria bacterium]MBW1983324.1 sigma-54-dependent Fis family transcriptional regulator [Deltaproteobacteria bacterium]MBW2181596.1 sigma-54-dependent Fis family transcriptional regulator [Deltaproteobacteria bacterium]